MFMNLVVEPEHSLAVKTGKCTWEGPMGALWESVQLHPETSGKGPDQLSFSPEPM